MTDKIVNLFNKQPIKNEDNKTELEEVLKELQEVKDSLEDLIVIYVNKDQELTIRSSSMTTESAYYLLGLAQLSALQS